MYNTFLRHSVTPVHCPSPSVWFSSTLWYWWRMWITQVDFLQWTMRLSMLCWWHFISGCSSRLN